ncbi:SNX21 protein, partial [Polyodon spathula]|nr:sorting nexin-21 [Polyodon spathula]XP_041112757.1 sorting nexin-21 [Polyodon spathula]MBN3288233.1 SNX21 protein [Polyodon spathula]
MASKLLHRLRRSLFREVTLHPHLGGAEDFPESSELDDDTEGLSSRFSGTLSFEGEPEPEPESEGENSELDSDSDVLGDSVENGTEIAESSPACQPPAHNMLTKQLQDSWKKSRTQSIPERLLFEVTDASVVQEGASKYVLYTVHVMKSGQFDKTPSPITRRYTDFNRLHSQLRGLYRDEMQGITFPRKKLRRNFAAETIARRSRAFEQYLTHLHSLVELRRAPVFLEFFYLGDLQAGQNLLRAGQYQEAVGCLLNALSLQEKLGCRPQGHWIFTLAILVASFQELEQPEKAQEYCERALQDLSSPSLELQQQHPLLVPLLQAIVRLSWKVSKEKRQWESQLQQLRDSGVDVSSQPSLKEYLVKESLEGSEGGRHKGDDVA